MGKYNCEFCNYLTDRQNDMSKHKQSKKHKQKEQQSNRLVKGSAKVRPRLVDENKELFKCVFCGNSFAHKSSLSNHKKACENKDTLVQTYEEKIKNVENKYEEKIKHITPFSLNNGTVI